MEAKKYDQEKIRLELLPTEALEEVAKVLSFGAKKYGDWNWKRGMSYSRLLGAALRHLFSYLRGDSTDNETGLSHCAHACCCLLFLITYEKLKLGKDDRYDNRQEHTTDVRLAASEFCPNETPDSD